MIGYRLQDAARMADRAGLAIEVTSDGFLVRPRRGRAWAACLVSFGEVECATINLLAEAVRRVEKDLAGAPKAA